VISIGILNPLQHQAQSLALGLMIGGILQLMLLVFSIKLPPLHFENFKPCLPYLKKMCLLLLPVIFSLMVSRINRLIDLSFASSLIAGSLSSLVYATVLINVPLGVIGVASNNVIFPIIAKLKASQKHQQFQEEIIAVFYYLTFIGIPVSIFLYLYSYEVCKILFIAIPSLLSISSLFDHQALSLLSTSLQYYSPGLLAMLLLPFVIKIFHSCTDTKTPALISLVVVLVNIILNYYFTPIWQNKGIAAATTIASFLQICLLVFFLSRKKIFVISKNTFLNMIQVLLITLALSIACKQIHSNFTPLPEVLLFFSPFFFLYLFQKKSKKPF
ncbi:polysaccharide biosynthesis C-terminal domain-containing protein, partial [bacterium]|nr:polysaccharide biosynthesis C-terminal domain-containing protein [bacterium]